MLSDSTSIKRWLSFDAFPMRRGEANPYRTDKRGDKMKPKNESKQSWKAQKFGGERNENLEEKEMLKRLKAFLKMQACHSAINGKFVNRHDVM